MNGLPNNWIREKYGQVNKRRLQQWSVVVWLQFTLFVFVCCGLLGKSFHETHCFLINPIGQSIHFDPIFIKIYYFQNSDFFGSEGLESVVHVLLFERRLSRVVQFEFVHFLKNLQIPI